MKMPQWLGGRRLLAIPLALAAAAPVLTEMARSRKKALKQKI